MAEIPLMIITDIWGGDLTCSHLARYILTVDEAFLLARNEIAAGNLVNLRHDPGWREYTNFDDRMGKPNG